MSKRGTSLREVEKCERCGKKMRRTVQDRYQYVESGLSNVVLDGIAVYVCACGEQVVGLPNIERLHDLIFQKILTKPSPLRGDELRFLRKSMGVKSVDFARMLRVHPTTMSKWESGDQTITEPHDKLTRLSIVLTATARAKKQAEEAHRRVADQYLDFLGEISAIAITEANDDTVKITKRDLDDSPLMFRWGLTPSPAVELVV